MHVCVFAVFKKHPPNRKISGLHKPWIITETFVYLSFCPWPLPETTATFLSPRKSIQIRNSSKLDQIYQWNCGALEVLLPGPISAPWDHTEHVLPLTLLSKPHAPAFSLLSSTCTLPSLLRCLFRWCLELSPAREMWADSPAQGRRLVTASSGAGHSKSNHPKRSKFPRGNNGNELHCDISQAKAATADSRPMG